MFSALENVFNTPQRCQQQARQRLREQQINSDDTPSKRPRRTPTIRPTSPSPVRTGNRILQPLTASHATVSDTRRIHPREQSEQRHSLHDENFPETSEDISSRTVRSIIFSSQLPIYSIDMIFRGHIQHIG